MLIAENLHATSLSIRNGPTGFFRRAHGQAHAPRSSGSRRFLREETLHGADQVVELERLSNEGVDPGLERRVGLRGAAQEADRDLRPFVAEEREELRPVAVDDVEIEQEDIDRLTAKELLGAPEGPRVEHDVVLERAVDPLGPPKALPPSVCSPRAPDPG